MSGIRIEKYHIRLWTPDGTGEVRQDVWGVVWTCQNDHGEKELYFDEFAGPGERVNWVERFNSDPDNIAKGLCVERRAELYRVLGDEREWVKWKREYARKRLPRIDKYICMTNKKFKD